MFVLPALPVLPEGERQIGDVLLIGDEGSRITHPAEVLRRIEAECPREPDASGPKPISNGARRLAGVLDEREAERSEPAHVSELPVEMDREDVSRAGS